MNDQILKKIIYTSNIHSNQKQIASNHSTGINFKDFMKLYKKYTKEPYSLLVNDMTLSSDYH